MYNGIDGLRAPNESIPYTQEMIDEWIKCANSYEYFIENYIQIRTLGSQDLQTIQLRSYQKKMLGAVDSNRFTAILCPRQSGKTTSVATYAVWCLIFKSNFQIGVAADKDDTAVEIIDRIKTAYENIPYWMQQGIMKWNEHEVVLENGSSIEAAATTKKTFRGRTFNIVILDEFAFVDQSIATEFYTAIYPVISSDPNTKFIIISTPNGHNLFHKIWNESLSGKNSFFPVRINWFEVPGRDEKFRDTTIADIGMDRWLQEFCCEFLGNSSTLIPAAKLGTLACREPEKRMDDVKFYELPVKEHVYVLTADTSRGKGLDYHAFSVVDVTEFPYKVVATFKNNELDTMFYPSVIHEIARTYNEAYVLVELNDAGKQVSDILFQDLEYMNVLTTQKRGRAGQVLSFSGVDRGVTTSAVVKTIGCATLKSMIMNDKLIINDYDIFSELTNFEIQGKTYRAKKGTHDDLVMTLVLFAWATTQPMFADISDHDIRKIMFQERIRQMEENLVPFGFIVNDGDPVENF